MNKWRQLAIPKLRDFWSKIFEWNSFVKLYFLSIWWIILPFLFGSFCSWPPKVVNFAVSECTWINSNNFLKSLNVAPQFFGNVRQNCDSPAICSTLWDKFTTPFFVIAIFLNRPAENAALSPVFVNHANRFFISVAWILVHTAVVSNTLIFKLMRFGNGHDRSVGTFVLCFYSRV